MDATLAEIVQSQLRRTERADAPWAPLVVAAVASETNLAKALRGDEWQASTAAVTQPPPNAFLNSLAVEGFRGIGPTARLEIPVGPGLTLIVGRNGSGKSSFSEALEFLLTGENQRWAARSKVWKEGWRNLHHVDTARIEADFTVEGQRGMRVSRIWQKDAKLEASPAVVQVIGARKSSLAEIGWERALELYRPFLSYSELGSMFDEGPTALYDRFALMLGLDGLVLAQKRLQAARLDRTKLTEASANEARGLVEELQRLDDTRARTSSALLRSKYPDLDALEAVAVGASGAEDQDLVFLRQVVATELASEEDVEVALEALDRALAGTAAIEQSSADARRLAQLLNAALGYEAMHTNTPCPVCSKGRLDAQWRREALSKVGDLMAAAAVADAAHEAETRALEEVHSLLIERPKWLHKSRQPLSSLPRVVEAWSALSSAPTAVTELSAHVARRYEELRQCLAALQQEARVLMEEKEGAWRRCAAPLLEWVVRARLARAAAATVPLIQSAEKWLKDASASIRDERFTPIALAAKDLWSLLRQQSSVELEEVALGGTGTFRRAVLRVEVDGIETEALSVMSQGELHAIALSLFLPRATLDESPFGFVIIDDPVQSMDPSRVDGLARVLERVAKTRQVIVLTHDERLTEAVRRLAIAATVIGVSRREESVVELFQSQDPVRRNLEDALALAKTEDLPAEVARRTVPGFCRAAIEAACIAATRRRRLVRGERHADVDLLLEGQTLTSLVALALFDNAARGSEVMARVNRDFGSQAGDVLVACKRGAHAAYDGDLLQLVRRSDDLSARLMAIA